MWAIPLCSIHLSCLVARQEFCQADPIITYPSDGHKLAATLSRGKKSVSIVESVNEEADGHGDVAGEPKGGKESEDITAP